VCPFHIFAERLSGLTQPYARRTRRLDTRLTQLACETGGEVAARVSTHQRLGSWSPDTFLRLIRRLPDPALSTPRVLGIDDWAKRKGQTYGSILCDMEQHRVIDLLPDRETETVSRWLQVHPGVEIVCRDRANAYAEGIRIGAPQAIQIADRFHLMVNLGDAVKRIVDRHHRQLRVLVEETVPLVPNTTPISSPTRTQLVKPTRVYKGRLSPSPKPPSTIRQHQAVRREIRAARWQEICRLNAEGLTLRAICRQLHTTRKTVRRALRVGGQPPPNGNTLRSLAPHVDFLTERWQDGQHNARQLHRELVAQGHPVSYSAVMYFVAPLRAQARATTAHANQCATQHANSEVNALAVPAATELAPCLPEMTPPQSTAELSEPSLILTQQKTVRLNRRLVSRLLVGNIEFTPQYQNHVDQLCAALPELALARQLATSFRTILNQRQADQLEPWLQQAATCALPEFNALAESLSRDKAAVSMAFTSTWSSGQVEGQVNRLKLIKRSMYGRGKLDLLRKRVLYKSDAALLS